jgi:hypothetical protein
MEVAVLGWMVLPVLLPLKILLNLHDWMKAEAKLIVVMASRYW